MQFSAELCATFGRNQQPIGQQGFLSEQLAKGFSCEVKKWLDALLSNPKLVVFVGYGGLDRFDVIPYFQDMTTQINGTALWIEYSTSPDIESLSPAPPEKLQILSKFQRWLYVKCDPKVILNHLFSSAPAISTSARTNGVLPQYPDLIRKNVACLAKWNVSVSKIRRKTAWKIRRILISRISK